MYINGTIMETEVKATLLYITWSLNRLSRKCTIYRIIDPIPTIPSMSYVSVECVCVLEGSEDLS